MILGNWFFGNASVMNAKNRLKSKKYSNIQQHQFSLLTKRFKCKKGATHCLMITKCSVETVNLHPISIQCK